jgi:hypothetical protein
VHDALADHVRQPGLTDAEDAGGHRHADHAGDEQREQAGVALRDGLVEHLAQQERRDHAQPGGERDEREHNGQPAAVGPEQGRDAAQVSRALVHGDHSSSQ